jgi:hypothetical protein
MRNTRNDGTADPAAASAAEPTAAPSRRPARAAQPPAHIKLAAARRAVEGFLADEFQAREVRITKLAPSPDAPGGWLVEAEMLVPDLGIRALGLELTQEVLEKQRYAVELGPDMTITSYEVIDERDG